MENKSNMKQYIFIIALSVLSLVEAQAQYDQTIISVGDRALTVDQAFKISDLPSTIDSVYESRELDYILVPRQVEVNYEPKEIKAAKLKVLEPLTKLYRGYVKGGVGTYTTPLLDVHFNSIRNRDWAYGIDVNHLSSQGGIKDAGDNSYGDTHFGGWAKRYVNKHTVEAGLAYDLNKIHYYGFDPGDLDIKAKDYEQKYNTIQGHVEVLSHYKDSAKVQHRIGLNIRNMSALSDANESSVVFSADASKTIEDYRFGLGMELDVNTFKEGSIKEFVLSETQDGLVTELETQKGNIFRLNPTIHARKKDLTADIGLGIVFDSSPDKNVVHLYPQAYLSYSLFDDLFTPYAGLTGTLKRNSFYSLAQENPFIHNSNGLRNTSKDLELYGGIRGTIFDNLAFNVRASIEDYDDYAFFVNDTIFSVENKFTVFYDDLKVVRIAGELTYEFDENLTLGGRLEIMSNNTENFSEAFNLPNMRFTLDGRYDLDDTFVVKAQVFAAGKRYGASMMPQEGDNVIDGDLSVVKLGAYVDMSLGVEYRYTKRISAFLDINNLTGGRYQRWNQYRVQPALIMGGLTYSF